MDTDVRTGPAQKAKKFVKCTLRALWGLTIMMFVGVGTIVILRAILYFCFNVVPSGH